MMNQFIQRNDTFWWFTIMVIFWGWVLNENGLRAESPKKYSAQKASFSVAFKEEVTAYRVMGAFVLPNEIITIAVNDSGKKRVYQVETADGKLSPIAPFQWNWQAPAKKGLYPLTIQPLNSSDSITLNIFVMIPFSELQGEYLNGYQIGKYPATPLKNLPIYQPPKGFIEVTPKNEATPISPHFKLNQFLCKQNCGALRYVVLQERLILKLELILEKVNEKGYHCNTLHIMSGYRTPHYNKAIGNVTYSRHCWGGAADIFIDEHPEDEAMDDLNKDGKIDLNDATILYDLIAELSKQPRYQIFAGGLGKYKANAAHGPFVHVDVRGFMATWGD